MEQKQERMWGMLCHLGALVGYIMPFGNVIGPLVIWLLKKQESPFIDAQGKEALNFQITMTIAAFVAVLLFVIVIGFPLLIGVALFNLVMIILAAVKVNNGDTFTYPVCIRLIK